MVQDVVPVPGRQVCRDRTVQACCDQRLAEPSRAGQCDERTGRGQHVGDHRVGLWQFVECVSVEGIASLIDDEATRTAAATIYAQKYSPPDEQASMREFVLGHAVFEVRPVKALAIIEREEDFASKATRWTG